ncbi:MAG: hypothetical protein OEY86_06205 [Nitrospira sp.]|nr:hypothetical protein [Nitrospira sp.]
MASAKYRLGFVGLQEHETLIFSCLLSIHSNKWPKPWEASANGSPHAVLYDLSNPEGLREWQQAQSHAQPVPIAYTPDALPDVRWSLKKPSDTSALIDLLKELAASFEKKIDAAPIVVVDQPVPVQQVESPQPTTGNTDSDLWGRLAAVAERHQAADADAKEIKLILGGSIGAGKTTALRTISEIPPIHTEARASDIVRRMKSETTVAMDYGEFTLPNGKKLRLYGTPGQVRYEFMSDILCRGGLGLVLLINNAGDNPLHELTHYLRVYGDFIKKTGAVLGITHMDQKSAPSLHDYETYLARDKWTVPVFSVDVRQREQILAMLETLVAQLETRKA